MTTPSFPTISTRLLLQGPLGPLEVSVDPIESPTPSQNTVAILCHPLSTEGGSMNNKVITMTARSLRESGVATVRFNFRGVGQSAGQFDDGAGEADDLRAIAAWVRQQRPEWSLWLAGFSFGAYVSLLVADALNADGLISIAPPVGRWDFSKIVQPHCPWLVVQGEDDEIVDPHEVYAWVESLIPPPELLRIPEASHFFHHKLIDLRTGIQRGVTPWLSR
ncbi:MAG: alpha/beta hydrolase [Xanthomonadaceae bacterium]|nr:alpha/beta hydrolase [Xanthomonadaceae bacterium]